MKITLQHHLEKVSDSGPWAHFSQFALRNTPLAAGLSMWPALYRSLYCLDPEAHLAVSPREQLVADYTHLYTGFLIHVCAGIPPTGSQSALHISSSCTDDAVVLLVFKF